MARRKIAVIDAETDPFKQGRVNIAPFVWGFYDGEEYHQFDNTRFSGGSVIEDCTQKLIDFLAGQKLTIYAHNGGKFDYHFLLKYADDWQSIKIINGRVASFKIGDCEFRDSYNILPVPLSAFSKDEMDYSIMERDRRYKGENYRLISDYLKADCIYLFEFVSQFIERYGKQLTIAGAAMRKWEEISGKAPPRTTKKYYDKLSKYYFGGRVECFETGEINRPFKMFDINSAYPYAMLSRHPIDTEHSVLESPPKEYWKALLKREYLGNCFFSVLAISRGAFPWRCESGALVFPNDGAVREFHVSGWEMQAALETKTARIIKVKSVVMFNTAETFEDYIIGFYTERLAAKKKKKTLKADSTRWREENAIDIITKLFMNALYGKYGSRPDNYQEYMVMPDELFEYLISPEFSDAIPEHMEDIAREKDAYSYALGGVLDSHVIGQKPLEENKKRYYNVATAASITGFVRAFLWRHICKCKGVIYCDTDSIAAVEFNGFAESAELGDWEEENAFTHGYVAGKKLYAFYPETGEPKTASKGVRLEADQIASIAKGAEILYRPIAPTFSVKGPPVQTNRLVKMRPKIEATKDEKKFLETIDGGYKRVQYRNHSLIETEKATHVLFRDKNGELTHNEELRNTKQARNLINEILEI